MYNEIDRKYEQLIKVQDKEAAIYNELSHLTKKLSIEEIIVKYIKFNHPMPVLIPDISLHLSMLDRQKASVDIFHIVRDMIAKGLLPERTNRGYIFHVG